MKFSFSVLVVAAAAAVVPTAVAQSDAAAATTTNHFATCPVLASVRESRKYHAETACDIAGYNQFKSNLDRAANIKRLQAAGSYRKVPTSKTVVCPEHVEALYNEDQVDGFDTMWIAENTASTPVVLAYTKNVNGLPVEYSAVHPEVTPPQADPDAILLPGAWRALYTYEGHVFHVRELDETTGQTGRIVLQHRVGVYPVGGNYQGELSCPDIDEEPVIQQENRTIRHPKFKRTPTQVFRPCNTIDIGFRNLASCPLHGYYVRPRKEPTPSGCTVEEVFKYHLGAERLNPVANDFMWQWQSTHKYEGSFVGHSFTFRLAANPEILVDSITLEPTRIIDCPNLQKQQTAVGVSAGAEAIVVPSGQVSYNKQCSGSSNSTRSYDGLVVGNYTQQQRDGARRRAALHARTAVGGIVSV